MSTEPAIFHVIRTTLAEHPVVLYMKGTADAPMCGFSARVVQILRSFNAPFHGVNVLADPEVREGVKQFNDWPTVPQLFVQGEFVGGCDIVSEMFTNGELETLLRQSKVI